MNVAMMPRNCRRHRRQIPPGALNYVRLARVRPSLTSKRLRGSGADGWEVLWPEPLVNMAVVNRDEVLLLALVIKEWSA
jgi:hypothetical protein